MPIGSFKSSAVAAACIVRELLIVEQPNVRREISKLLPCQISWLTPDSQWFFSTASRRLQSRCANSADDSCRGSLGGEGRAETPYGSAPPFHFRVSSPDYKSDRYPQLLSLRREPVSPKNLGKSLYLILTFEDELNVETNNSEFIGRIPIVIATSSQCCPKTWDLWVTIRTTSWASATVPETRDLAVFQSPEECLLIRKSNHLNG